MSILIPKTEQLKSAMNNGDLSLALGIAKTFRYNLTKEEMKILHRANDIAKGNGKLYEQLGYNLDTELEKAKHILTHTFCN